MTRRNKRKVHRKKKTSTGRIYVAIIMLFMIAVMAVQVVRLYDKNQTLKKQEANLQSELDAANEKSEQIKEQEEYVDTDEYIETEASQKLGLTHDNWIIFREKED